jgi:outer membrane lipoprotein SlyB
MAALVWFTMGVALWHFTVFVPDRFRGGIVGAFMGAAVGAMASGAIAQIVLGKTIGDTDLATAFYAIPGTVIGLAVVYAMGVRAGVEAEHL